MAHISSQLISPLKVVSPKPPSDWTAMIGKRKDFSPAQALGVMVLIVAVFWVCVFWL